VLERYKAKKYPTLVFCNTVASCRAVEYALNETQANPLSYHGDLNSKERSANLETFKAGGVQYLVCTDIAARGLDIPDIGHVVMFDFPMNPVDYIHRAGRCGRAGRKGIVTALVTKRDKVLSDAIQGAIARGLPIDNLSSSKRDYQEKGKLASVVGRAPKKNKPKPARSGFEARKGPVGREGSRTAKPKPSDGKGKEDSSAKPFRSSGLKALPSKRGGGGKPFLEGPKRKWLDR
jgi:superfamily II DNA/RNA helicase